MFESWLQTAMQGTDRNLPGDPQHGHRVVEPRSDPDPYRQVVLRTPDHSRPDSHQAVRACPAASHELRHAERLDQLRRARCAAPDLVETIQCTWSPSGRALKAEGTSKNACGSVFYACWKISIAWVGDLSLRLPCLS